MVVSCLVTVRNCIHRCANEAISDLLLKGRILRVYAKLRWVSSFIEAAQRGSEAKTLSSIGDLVTQFFQPFIS